MLIGEVDFWFHKLAAPDRRLKITMRELQNGRRRSAEFATPSRSKEKNRGKRGKSQLFIHPTKEPSYDGQPLQKYSLKVKLKSLTFSEWAHVYLEYFHCFICTLSS
jgi:hypothetical protein